MNILSKLLLAYAFLLNTACTTHIGKTNTPIEDNENGFSYRVEENIQFSDTQPQLNSDLYIPRSSVPRPVVLVIHGGSWSSGNRSLMTSIAKRLATEGFFAFNLNYRLAPQFPYPSQMEDCEDALRWIHNNAQRYNIDSTKVAVWGYSAGAHLAVQFATLLSEQHYQKKSNLGPIQAAVGGSGPYNFTLYPNDETIETFLGKTYKENRKAFEDASPLYHVNPDTPPMFLYHGTWDQIVDPQHTMQMHQALNQAKVRNELYLVKGMGHIPLYLFDHLPVSNAIEFLKASLK